MCQCSPSVLFHWPSILHGGPACFSSFRASLSLGHGLCAANRNRVFHATWPWSRTTCRILDGDTAALMLQIQPSCNMSQHFTAERISQHEQSVTENGPPRQIQTGPPSPSHCQATICKAEQEFQKTATPIQTIGTYGILNEALVLRNLQQSLHISLLRRYSISSSSRVAGMCWVTSELRTSPTWFWLVWNGLASTPLPV